MGSRIHPIPNPSTRIGILIQGEGVELETYNKTEISPCTRLHPQPLDQSLALSSSYFGGWVDDTHTVQESKKGGSLVS